MKNYVTLLLNILQKEIVEIYSKCFSDSVFRVNIMIRRDVCNKAERTARGEEREADESHCNGLRESLKCLTGPLAWPPDIQP